MNLWIVSLLVIVGVALLFAQGQADTRNVPMVVIRYDPGPQGAGCLGTLVWAAILALILLLLLRL